MKGGAWLVLAVSALMGLGLTIGAIASRRQMSTAVVVVLSPVRFSTCWFSAEIAALPADSASCVRSPSLRFVAA